MKEALDRLAGWTSETLLDCARKRRRYVAQWEWELAALLLAMERQGVHQAQGFSSMTRFAEDKLELEGQRTAELLRMARALEYLPHLSAAFKSGAICYSKI